LDPKRETGELSFLQSERKSWFNAKAIGAWLTAMAEAFGKALSATTPCHQFLNFIRFNRVSQYYGDYHSFFVDQEFLAGHM
jgi:hypothetical protein